MKAKILTFQFAHNYGAVLQAYSLKAYLLKIGIHAEVVNFIPNSFLETYALVRWKTNKSVKQTLKEIISIPFRFKQYSLFKSYINLELCNSLPNYSLNRLKQQLEEADVIFCGSDQIWNDDITGEIGTYYLNNISPNSKKVAYAASFGKKSLSDFQKQMIKDALSKFNSISIREEDGKDDILSILQVEPKIVIDPVFLTSLPDWETYSERAKIKPKSKYVLLYTLKNNKQLMQIAKHYAELLGIDLFTIHPTAKNQHVGTLLRNVGPYEFLYLIRNAELICTDSFHATAFSMIFKKKYFHIINNEKENRIESLLGRIHVYDSCQEDLFDNKILAFDKVNDNMLQSIIQDSKGFISAVLENKVK